MTDLEELRKQLGRIGDPVGFLAGLFFDSPSGFALLGADGSCLVTNAAFIELFGTLPPPEYDIRQDDTLRRMGLLGEIERVYAGETVKLPTLWYDPRELSNLHITEGRRVAVRLTFFPLLDAGGAVYAVAVIYADETEAELAKQRLETERAELRRLAADLPRSERALKQSRQELALIIDAAPVAIAYCDAEERHVYVNRIYAWRLGREADDIIGKTMSAVLPEQIYSIAQSHLDAVLAGKTLEFEMEMLDGRGELIYVRCANAPDIDETGRVRGFVTVITNLTDTKRAEREIHTLNARLEQRVAERTSQLEVANRELAVANRELESFAYSVSHDLRTPLRSINGFSQVLLAEYGERIDEEGRQSLSRIESSARHMGELIDALLGLSRLGRQNLDVRPIDTGALLTEVAAELGLGRDDDGAWLHLGRIPACRADVHLLKQVFLNLLGNALKFTRKGEAARINVDCTEIGDEQIWTVEDHGIGFDMRYAGKLFEPFHRLHPQEHYEGTGVGLALVRRIVQRHGGRIWAEAEPGKGAIFRFTLQA